MTTGGHVLSIAFVNNMPDSAFESTERQFLDVITAASAGICVRVDRYTLAGIERSDAVREHLNSRYCSLDALWDSSPDAVVITGTEPLVADLRSEPYWDGLADLITWAEASTASVLLSCLAAHAAVLIFDEIGRERLAHKCSGVFTNDVGRHHPLLDDLEDGVAIPHSRHNGVPEPLLEARGYETLLTSAESSWTLAVKERGHCLLVLCQGHPEYGTVTLLREYRRDVRRFMGGEQASYPAIPLGYFSNAGQNLARAFEERALNTSRPSRLWSKFPYKELESGLVNTWRPAAERLYANWLRHVLARSGAAELV